MRRLVAVSNRILTAGCDVLAGGVAVAITESLRGRGGLWFGWSGKVSDRPEETAQLQCTSKLTTAVVDMSPDDYDGYYNGHANQCLWPLCHFRLDLMTYDDANYSTYHRVNERMARALRPLLREDDLIWVHDYHLVPMAAILRSLGCRQRMGFFLHVPFPPADLLVTLPCHQDLVRNLLNYDLIGMQTEADLRRLSDYIEREGHGSVHDGVANAFGMRSQLGCFPVGIDTARFVELASSARAEHNTRKMKRTLAGHDQIISVDRLDYSKGLLRRIAAFEHLLAGHSDLHGKIEFLQIAPVSRGELQHYQTFRRDLEIAAARVNGRFSRVDWTPLRYLNRALARDTLAGLYRASRIGLVTPMRDGMNLVCKEYVAAQDPADPGVLVLSRFAGAAQTMKAALIVNPYDIADTADAIALAQRMPSQERRNRHQELMCELKINDSSHWAKAFVDALSSADEFESMAV